MAASLMGQNVISLLAEILTQSFVLCLDTAAVLFFAFDGMIITTYKPCPIIMDNCSELSLTL